MNNSMLRRLEALEVVLAAKLNPSIAFFMADPERDPEEFIAQLVAEGRLDPRARSHVKLVRWRTAAEERAANDRP